MTTTCLIGVFVEERLGLRGCWVTGKRSWRSGHNRPALVGDDAWEFSLEFSVLNTNANTGDGRTHGRRGLEGVAARYLQVKF